MKWTPQADEALTAFWNKHTPQEPYSDKRIAALFGTTTYTVGKRRSILGLVSVKKAHHSRAPKAIRNPLAPPPYVLLYERDGQKHFLSIPESNRKQASDRGILIMDNDVDIKTVFVLQPVLRLDKQLK